MRMRRISGWSRWAIWAQNARRAGRSPRRSGQWRAEHGRRTRPWIPEPGLWLQFDYGDGPVIGGRRTSLLCAWLAWSRYRVIVALVDRTLPSVVLGLDRVLRETRWRPDLCVDR